MNEIEPLSHKPSGFGAVLGNGFSLVGRTFSNSGVLTLLVAVPSTILLTYGISAYMTALGGFMGSATPENMSPEQMNRLVGPMMLFYAIMFIYFAVLLILQTVTALFAWEAADGRRIGILEGLGTIFRKPFWIVMVQTFMIGVIMMLAFFAFALLAGGAAVGATAGDSGGAAATILSILVILFALAILYFVVATIFRVHTVVIEDRGPWRGLIASMALVKGNWWKVLALLIFIYVAVAIVSAPFYLLMADDMIDILNAMKGGSSNDPEVMAEFAATMQGLLSWKFIAAQVIQGAATWLLLSNFLTAMYIELRARRGDFEEMDDSQLDDTAWGEPLRP